MIQNAALTLGRVGLLYPQISSSSVTSVVLPHWVGAIMLSSPDYEKFTSVVGMCMTLRESVASREGSACVCSLEVGTLTALLEMVAEVAVTFTHTHTYTHTHTHT
eukprot:GHVR01068354.1.p1 GENE.GHVR01068354.1~~GHVR01068354.1.p1  ORF type:complete len:105 (-),score=58.73 GHVR01068354.1:147-461(-)